jgi:hypothetical protein
MRRVHGAHAAHATQNSNDSISLAHPRPPSFGLVFGICNNFGGLSARCISPDVKCLRIFRKPISSHVQNEPDQSHFLEKLDRDHVAECISGSNMARGAGDDHLDVHL